jgi:ubiquinone/menaquinone biosynthesis C-methylase UbiE
MNLQDLKKRYRGELARTYESRRKGTAEWEREQEVVESFLKLIQLGPDDLVVDIPVGTGRFLDLYHRLGCQVIGLDISEDMLAQAAARAAELGIDAKLRVGDITRIDLEDGSARVIVCVRILNLVDFEVFQHALAEATRVSSAYVIAGIQIRRQRRSGLLWWRPTLRAARTKRSVKSSGRTTTPHPETAVRRELRRRGLMVVRKERVGSSDRTPYHLYLLRRSA